MIRRSKRMLPILNLAERNEKNAALVLARSQQSLKECQNKLAMMREYRNEYANNFTAGISSASLLRDKHNFIQQIDQSIELLEKQISQHSVQHGLDQKEWLKTRQKSNALDKVVKQFRSSENKQQNQREQLEQDDRVTRRIKE